MEQNNEMPKCPRCGNKTIKNGKVKGKQRWQCKVCKFQFTRFTPRGRHPLMKALSVMLYLSGMSMNSIGFLCKVSAQSVLNWIRKFASENAEEERERMKIRVLELDEMWHYIGEKKGSCGYGRLLIEIQASWLAGNAGIEIQEP